MADLTYRVDIDTRQGIASIKQLNASLKTTEKQAAKTDGAFKGLGRGLLSIKTAVIGLVGSAGFGALIKSSISAADNIGKVADKVGLTTDQLQELRFAANQSGVSTGALDTSMQRFSRRIGEASKGTGVLFKTLENLNISIRKQDGSLRSTNDIFNDYTAAIAAAGSEQEKLQLAVAAFDSEGAGMVNMLTQGTEGLRAMRQEAHDLNSVISRDQVDAATRAQDAWGRVQAQFRGIATIAAGSLAPALEEVAAKLSLMLKNPEAVQSIADSFKKFGDALVYVTDNFGPLLEAVKNLGIAWATLGVAKYVGAFGVFKKATANLTKALTESGFKSAAAAKMFGQLRSATVGLALRLGAIGAAIWVVTEAIQGNIPWLNRMAKDLGLLSRTTEEEIQRVEEILAGGWDERLRFFGPEGLVEYYSDEELKGILADLRKKRAEEIKQLEEEKKKLAQALEIPEPEGVLDPSQNGVAEYTKEMAQSAEDLARSFLPLEEATKKYYDNIEMLQKGLQNAFKEKDTVKIKLYQDAIAAAADEYKKFTDELNKDDMDEAVKAFEEWSESIQSTVDGLAKEANTLKTISKTRADINRAIKQGIVTAENGQKALAKLAEQEKEWHDQQLKDSRKWQDGWQRAFNDYVDEATNAAQQAEDLFKTATSGMEDAIVNFAKTGKFEFKSFLNDIVNQLLQSQARQLVASIFSGINGGSSGFAGFFANGGTIPSGQFGIVGEQGPELVRGPAQVTPLTGVGGGSVTYNINAVDAYSFKQMVARDPQFIYAVTEQGRAGIPSRR